MFRPKEAYGRSGVSYTTLRKYVKQGKITPVVLESGAWRFREDVERLMGTVRKRKVVLYARVSSSTRDDLVEQVDYLQGRVKDYDMVITDAGSGLNMRRECFIKLLGMMLNNEVSRIVVAHRNRLVRFKVLEEVYRAHNCETQVLE
jgi:predicted site-specific integrase-resolvase